MSDDNFDIEKLEFGKGMFSNFVIELQGFNIFTYYFRFNSVKNKLITSSVFKN